MKEKLREAQARYEALCAEASLPQAVSDPVRYRELTRELSTLEPVVSAYRRLCRAEQEEQEARELMQDAESDPGLRRMAEEGHLICNHTVRHRDMSGFSREEFEKELHALEDVLREYTGLEMAKYYRPPEGRFSEENLKYAQDMGYKTVFWSLAYADWDNAKQPAPDKAMALLDANIHNGAIVLLHPTSKTNADILDTLMTKWEKDGYRFASLDELFAK